MASGWWHKGVYTFFVAPKAPRANLNDAEIRRMTAEPNCTIVELTSAESMFEHPFTHREVVAPNEAARFWTELDGILAALLDIERSLGFDGITIKVDCRTPTVNTKFEVWSPAADTQAGKLVGLIYDVAWEALSTPSAIKFLENLRPYLREG
ncbi:hypothetical protein [Bradyrhizobium sp. B117]|uniref:hypothetical protein n=1 Tax=Bradyrhizobium sp. B117 TaxID=3140246 RepID=UPI003182CA62